jgi:hypothetical protein
MRKPSPFELLLVKVERANQHIINFENAVNAFWASEPAPHVLLTKDNPQTQERTYYLRVLKEIPLEFSAFIGRYPPGPPGARWIIWLGTW